MLSVALFCAKKKRSPLIMIWCDVMEHILKIPLAILFSLKQQCNKKTFSKYLLFMHQFILDFFFFYILEWYELFKIVSELIIF